MSDKKTFREAFSDAKKAGKEKFSWNGKSYSTKTAEEEAKNMTSEQKLDAYNKAYSDEQEHYKKTGKPSKSKAEITKSYQNAAAADNNASKIHHKRMNGAIKRRRKKIK